MNVYFSGDRMSSAGICTVLTTLLSPTSRTHLLPSQVHARAEDEASSAGGEANTALDLRLWLKRSCFNPRYLERHYAKQ